MLNSKGVVVVVKVFVVWCVWVMVVGYFLRSGMRRLVMFVYFEECIVGCEDLDE